MPRLLCCVMAVALLLSCSAEETRISKRQIWLVKAADYAALHVSFYKNKDEFIKSKHKPAIWDDAKWDVERLKQETHWSGIALLIDPGIVNKMVMDESDRLGISFSNSEWRQYSTKVIKDILRKKIGDATFEKLLEDAVSKQAAIEGEQGEMARDLLLVKPE